MVFKLLFKGLKVIIDYTYCRINSIILCKFFTSFCLRKCTFLNRKTALNLKFKFNAVFNLFMFQCIYIIGEGIYTDRETLKLCFYSHQKIYRNTYGKSDIRYDINKCIHDFINPFQLIYMQF